MAIRDISTRLFHIRGEHILKVAQIRGDLPVSIPKGRSLYMVRLEVAPKGNPEITQDQFSLSVISTTDDFTYQKGLGGGQRGFVGNKVPYEKLIEGAAFPEGRTKTEADPFIVEAVVSIMAGYRYNCNMRLFTEYRGFRQIPPLSRDNFDELRTYMPAIIQAFREVEPLLR
jgi:hypothetical protein